MKIKIVIIASLVVLVAGAGAYYWHHTHHDQRPTTDERRALYHCPMHPQYISDKPGECPICGMNLVPIEEEKHEAGSMKHDEQKTTSDRDDNAPANRVSITISPERQQIIGIKTTAAVKEKAIKIIRTYGRVAYHPELAIAQREYIEAVGMNDISLVNAAKEKLQLLGMSKEQIRELGINKKVQSGLYLPQEGDSLWIYAVIYESELPYVVTGQEAKITLPNNDRVNFLGVIRAIDPVLDQATRSVNARIELNNAGEILKPNMFVNAEINIDLGEKLLIPKSAVIDTGLKKVAFISHEKGRLEPREVVTSAQIEDFYAVEEGIAEGDIVVTAANFLIDAESQLKAAIQKMIGSHKH